MTNSIITIEFFQEHGRATTLYYPICHNCNSIAKNVCLIHEVCGENNGAAFAISLKNVPGLSSSSRIHTRGWLIKDNNLKQCKFNRRLLGNHWQKQQLFTTATMVQGEDAGLRIQTSLVQILFGRIFSRYLHNHSSTFGKYS